MSGFELDRIRQLKQVRLIPVDWLNKPRPQRKKAVLLDFSSQ